MFDWITEVIARLGYFGVAILTFLENIFPPIPSEVVIPLAGFVAARGDLHIGVVIASGTVGSLAGATVWYALGRWIGEKRVREWVDRHGKWLTLSATDVDRAQQWFRRHGNAAVLLGRLMPGVRTFVSLPAGFSAMPIGSFVLYSALGTVTWTAALAYAGVLLQANFTAVGDYLNIVTNVVFGVLGVIVARRYVNCWKERGVPGRRPVVCKRSRREANHETDEHRRSDGHDGTRGGGRTLAGGGGRGPGKGHLDGVRRPGKRRR